MTADRARGRGWMAAARTEIAALLWFALFAGSGLGFALLASEVIEGDTHGFDRALLAALREQGNPAQPIGPPWVENFFLNVTSLGSTAVIALVTLAVLGYLLATRRRGAALLVFLSVLGGVLLPSLLKVLFDRARPDLVWQLVPVHSLSFPSGHAMGAAVTYLTLGALLVRVERQRRVKLYLMTVAMLIVLLVGVSRVFLGVHWPTDVLGGWCVGACWAALCWLAALWLQRRGKVETGTGTGGEKESPACD